MKPKLWKSELDGAWCLNWMAPADDWFVRPSLAYDSFGSWREAIERLKLLYAEGQVVLR